MITIARFMLLNVLVHSLVEWRVAENVWFLAAGIISCAFLAASWEDKA